MRPSRTPSSSQSYRFPHPPSTPTQRGSVAPSEHPSSPGSIASTLSSLSYLSISQQSNHRNRLRIDPLPTNTIIENATYLSPYYPLPSNDGSISAVLAALTAFAGPAAQSAWRLLESGGSKEHDPAYYIKETTRRLQAYYQISDVICQLVCPRPHRDMLHTDNVKPLGQACLLELVTGSSIFIHIGRLERVNGQGQRPVIFRNRLGQGPAMQQAYDQVVHAVEAWAELQTASWLTLQGSYDSNLRTFRANRVRNNISIHLSGDYPFSARFGSEVAGRLVDAIQTVDWAAYGQPAATSSITHLTPPTASPALQLPTSHTFALGNSENQEEDEDDDDDDDDESTFIGRRTTAQERSSMRAIGLSSRQIALIRLMVWEKPASQWHDSLQVIFQGNHGFIFAVLGRLHA